MSNKAVLLQFNVIVHTSQSDIVFWSYPEILAKPKTDLCSGCFEVYSSYGTLKVLRPFHENSLDITK